MRFSRADGVSTSPLYETSAAFDLWLKWLIAAVVAPGIVLLSMQPVVGWVHDLDALPLPSVLNYHPDHPRGVVPIGKLPGEPGYRTGTL